MPDFRFVNSLSGYATRIPAETWKLHEPEIRALHAAGKNRTEVHQTLSRERGFNPSKGQLIKQYEKWSLKTYATKGQQSSSGEEQTTCDEMTPAAPYVQDEMVTKGQGDEPGLEHETMSESPLVHLLDVGKHSMEGTDGPETLADVDPTASPDAFLCLSQDSTDAESRQISENDASGTNLAVRATLSKTLRPLVKANSDRLTERCRWLQNEDFGVGASTRSDEQMLSLATILRELGSSATAFEVLHHILDRKCNQDSSSDIEVLCLVIKCMLTAKHPMQELDVSTYVQQTKKYLGSTAGPLQPKRYKFIQLFDLIHRSTSHSYNQGNAQETIALLEECQAALPIIRILNIDDDDYRDFLSAVYVRTHSKSCIVSSTTHPLRKMSKWLDVKLRCNTSTPFKPLNSFMGTHNKAWVLLYLELLPAVVFDLLAGGALTRVGAHQRLYLSNYAVLGMVSRLLMPDESLASANFTTNLHDFLWVAESRLQAPLAALADTPNPRTKHWPLDLLIPSNVLDAGEFPSIMSYICRCIDRGQEAFVQRSMTLSRTAEELLDRWSFGSPQVRTMSFKLNLQRCDLERHTAQLKQSLDIPVSQDMSKRWPPAIPEHDDVSVAPDPPICPSLVSSDFQHFEESGIDQRKHSQAEVRVGRASTGVPSVISSLSAMSIDEYLPAS